MLALLLALSSLAPPQTEAEPAGSELGTTEIAQVLAEARSDLDRAEAAQEAGDAATAREVAGRVLELLAPLPLGEGHDETAEILERVGFVAYGTGDLAGAREAWSRAVDHRERTLPADHPHLLTARGNLAATMYEMGDLAGARALLEAVLSGYERTLPADHPDLFHARGNLAVTMYEMGDLAGARALQEAVLEARERTLPADHHELLAARGNLAVTMKLMGDLAAAHALQEAVLEARERTLPADHPDLLRARGNLAGTKYAMGDLAGARALFEAVLEAREGTLPADHPDLLLARVNLAGTMADMGDLAGAGALLEAVLEARERTRPADHPDLLRARGNLAAMMFRMGDLAGARALEEAVLEARERTLPADHPGLLLARGNLALTMRQMGDLAGARALEEAVLEARERTLPADHPDLLTARENLAATILKMGDLAGARALQEAVLEARERTLPADHPDLLTARGNLAATIMKMGDLADARALEEAVLEARERTLPADHPDLLTARGNLALTMRHMGDLAGARALEEAVLEAQERTLPADHPDLLRARGNLGATKYAMGDLAGARALGLDLARGMLLRLELLSVLSPREAREAVGGEAYRHSVVRFVTDSSGAEDEGAAEPIRFELAETLRAVASVSGGGAGDYDPRRREISTLRAKLNDLVSGGPGEGQSSQRFAAEVSQLTLERDRLERAIRGDLAKQGVVAGVVRAADVAKALPGGAAAVGYLRHRKQVLDPASSRIDAVGDVLAAHVLLADGSLTELELGAADELEMLARTWRASLGEPLARASRGALGERVERGLRLDDAGADPGSDAAGESEAGEALRKRILDPVLAALGDEIPTLFVCLDDFLHLVPIDALPLGPNADGERVRDRYRIVNEVSFARLLSNRPSMEGEQTLLAMGDVQFESSPDTPTRRQSAESFTPLPQTRIEAESVGRLFREELGEGVSLLTKAEATKDGFREKAPGARFLHVATHGWFAPETVPSTLDAREGDGALWSRTSAQEAVTGLAPMTLCGLALAGASSGRDSLGRVPGILTAEELAGIDLSACELAVLSACETNVGIRRAGQGIQSLQAALHAAGVRTAITSLWKVDDAMTRRLMELFYTYLWVEKMPKADALWRAKSDLRAEGAAVRDWAAWILSGDPR